MSTSDTTPATADRLRQPPTLRHRLVVAMIAAISMLALLAAPVGAQDDGAESQSTGPEDQSLFVEPPTVRTGGFIDVSGTCGSDAADTSISIGLSVGLGNEIVGTNIDTDDDGAFQATIVLPEDTTTGDGEVYARCGLGADRTPTAPITILDDEDDDGGSMPFLSINPSTATRGTTIDVTGSCGVTGANGVISIVLNGEAADGTVVDNVPTGPRGRFAGSFTLPAEGATGTTNVLASCTTRNGRTPTASLTIVDDGDDVDRGGHFLTVEPQRTVAGGLIQVAGSCGPDRADSSISLALDDDADRRTIATNIDTDDDGAFRSTVLLPDDVQAGEAVLTAICGPSIHFSPATELTIIDDSTDDDPENGDPDDGDPDDGDPDDVLDRGDTGEAVAFWQDRLNDWLQHSGADFALVVDGIFGPRTEQATLRFQITDNSLANDGDVHPVDRVALDEAIEELQADDPSDGDPDNDDPDNDDPDNGDSDNGDSDNGDSDNGDSDNGDPDDVLDRGDRGEAVAFWQDRLNDWLRVSGSDLTLVVDGIFGPRTEQATLRFQITDNSLANDGDVHPVDRVALEDAIAELGADDPDDGDPDAMTPTGVYFLNDGALVVGERLVPDARRVDVSVRELIDGPAAGFETDLGWTSAVPADTRISSLVVTPERAVIELSEAFETAADPVGAIAQIVFTLTQSPDIDSVDLWVDGQPMEIEDIGRTVNLTRDTFTQQVFATDPMPLILVESPRVGADVDSTFTLSGISNTFEANVRYQVTDPNGVIVIDDFTTATAGTGTWGTFEETITLPSFDRDGVASVIVFEESARDGSPTNVVEVPVFVDGSS